MIPEGYIEGANRVPDKHATGKSHLYKGTFEDPGLPLCRWGWNRDGWYSIWRGHEGKDGLCQVCLARARAGKGGVRWKRRWKKKSVGQV